MCIYTLRSENFKIDTKQNEINMTNKKYCDRVYWVMLS